MNIWLVGVGVDYEGVDISLVLDHPPTEAEIESLDTAYADYIRISEWIVGTDTIQSDEIHVKRIALKEPEAQ